MVFGKPGYADPETGLQPADERSRALLGLGGRTNAPARAPRQAVPTGAERPSRLPRHLASLIKGAETLVGRRVGSYRVLSLLGQGGMGSVWLAERADGLFARQVALKLIHPLLIGRQ